MSSIDAGADAAAAYDAMAEDYDAAVAEGVRPSNSLYERPAIFAMLGGVAGKRVMDVGCGTGSL